MQLIDRDRVNQMRANQQLASNSDRYESSPTIISETDGRVLRGLWEIETMLVIVKLARNNAFLAGVQCIARYRTDRVEFLLPNM